MKSIPQGLDQWLVWIDYLKSWLESKPGGLETIDWHEVKDLSYEDLYALGYHFGVEVEPENYEHRQSLMIDLNKDNTLVFFSKPRAFYYYYE